MKFLALRAYSTSTLLFKPALFFLLIFTLAKPVLAQQSILQKPISLSLGTLTLGEALSAIEKQTNCEFIYSSSLLDLQKKVTLNYQNIPLHTVLEEILDRNARGITVTGNQIKIQPGKGKGAVNGSVKTSDGKPAGFVTIGIKGQRRTQTDENGNFRLENIEVGRHLITANYVGLQAQQETITVIAGQTIIQHFTLREDRSTLDEVAIRSRKMSKITDKETEQVAKMALKNLENPQVYSVISKELFKEQMAADYKTALRSATGVNSLTQAGNGRVFSLMRGFYTDNYIRNGIPAYQATTVDPINIERIEVVKGPSGTLFGSGYSSYGGLVNRVTKKPLDQFYTEASYTVGSFGLSRLTLDLSSPLDKTGDLLFRVTSAIHKENSYQDFAFQNNFFLNPSLSYKVNDKLNLLLEVEYAKIHQNPVQTIDFDSGYQWNPNVLNSSLYDFSRTYNSREIDQKFDNLNIFLQGDYKINNNWKSQTLFSYTQVIAPEQYRTTNTMMGPETLKREVGQLSDQYSNIQLQQNFTGTHYIAGIKNRFLIGGNLSTLRQSSFYFITQMYDIVNLNQPKVDYISKRKLQETLSKSAVNPTSNATLNYGFYVSDVISFTDRLHALLSLRYDVFKDNGAVDLNSGISPEGYSQRKFAPKVGLTYQIVKNQVALFGNYQNGFTYSPAKNRDNKLFKPEQANQFEGGVKVELFDKKFSGTVSYYDILVKDKVRPDPDNRDFSLQDATQKSKGIEIDLSATPIENFNILLGYGFNSNIYTKADAGIQGKRPMATPRHIFTSWASYKFQESIFKNFGAGIGLISNSSAYLNDTNTLNLPAFTILNSTLFYDNSKIRLGFRVDNLTNKDYYAGYYFVAKQNPRSFAFNLSWKI